MIDNATRAVAEMMDGIHKMTGTPQGDILCVAYRAVERAGLPANTVTEALRYLRSEAADRL